jgi:hypothetical protein
MFYFIVSNLLLSLIYKFLCMYRKKPAYIQFSTIQGFKYLLRVLELYPMDKGGRLYTQPQHSA